MPRLPALIIAATFGFAATAPAAPPDRQPPDQRLDRDRAGNDTTAPAQPVEQPRHAQRTEGLPLAPSGGGVPGQGNVRAGQLQDYSVVLQDGAKLGSVQDVILRPENGRIAYLSVQVGSRLDLRSERYDIPWDYVMRTDAQTQQVVVRLARTDFASSGEAANPSARNSGSTGNGATGGSGSGPTEKR